MHGHQKADVLKCFVLWSDLPDSSVLSEAGFGQLHCGPVVTRSVTRCKLSRREWELRGDPPARSPLRHLGLSHVGAPATDPVARARGVCPRSLSLCSKMDGRWLSRPPEHPHSPPSGCTWRYCMGRSTTRRLPSALALGPHGSPFRLQVNHRKCEVTVLV